MSSFDAVNGGQSIDGVPAWIMFRQVVLRPTADADAAVTNSLTVANRRHNPFTSCDVCGGFMHRDRRIEHRTTNAWDPHTYHTVMTTHYGCMRGRTARSWNAWIDTDAARECGIWDLA